MLVYKGLVECEHGLVLICVINTHNGSLFSLEIKVASGSKNDLFPSFPIYLTQQGNLCRAYFSGHIELSPSGVPGHTMNVEDTIVHGDDLVTEDGQLGRTTV